MTGRLKRRVAVLGASGGVGRHIVERLLAAGFQAVCQTRSAEKLADLAQRAEIHAFDPRDKDRLSHFVRGVDAVIFALGTDRFTATTLFSETTAALIAAMKEQHVARLIAITGVGAGDTRGHGGFLYNWIIFPLFTRKRYADKTRQEELIAASGLDWTIIRPAPFSNDPVTDEMEVHTVIRPETQLSGITRDEVAAFVVTQLDTDRYMHERPFIGHR